MARQNCLGLFEQAFQVLSLGVFLDESVVFPFARRLHFDQTLARLRQLCLQVADRRLERSHFRFPLAQRLFRPLRLSASTSVSVARLFLGKDEGEKRGNEVYELEQLNLIKDQHDLLDFFIDMNLVQTL